MLSVFMNVVIVLMTVLGLYMMLTGKGSDKELAAVGWKAFKYFTVESNVLMGIVSLVYVILQIPVLTGRSDALPRWCAVLKMAATVSVALTMVTVFVFLAPNSKKGYFSLFTGSNLFFHFLIPLLAVLDHIFWEPETGITFPELFYCLIPAVLYGTVYMVNVLKHSVDGHVSGKYDWYGFVKAGTKYSLLAALVVFAATYVIAVLLWLAGR